MPNYVRSEIVIKGPKLVIDRIQNEILTDGMMSFENIIPSTSILPYPEVYCSNYHEYIPIIDKRFRDMDFLKKTVKCQSILRDIQYVLNYKKIRDGRVDSDIVHYVEQVRDNLLETGYATFYDSNTCEWNSKWDLHDFYMNVEDCEDIQILTLAFTNPHAPPYPIYKKLMSTYKLDMNVHYVHEDVTHIYEFSILSDDYTDYYVDTLSLSNSYEKRLEYFKMWYRDKSVSEIKEYCGLDEELMYLD